MQPQAKRCRRSTGAAAGAPGARPNPLPGCDVVAANRYQFTGYYTGLSVEVTDGEHMRQLYENGCFGVGSQTRAAPAVLWQQPAAAAAAGADETLILCLEEAFFLHRTLRCLEVRSLADALLTTEELFAACCAAKPTFVRTYVAYVYLRAQNWVVKAGLKFGGDFLLYKEGPRYYHASYVVLVRGTPDYTDMDTEPATSSVDCVADLDTPNMQGHYRIAEASKKELLIVEISSPAGMSADDDVLSQLHRYTASEFVPKRFNLHQERCSGATGHQSAGVQ